MIVIPMAGLSSRFHKAGYTLPKYMLEARGKTLFEHSLESFSNYFESEFFLFIALNKNKTKQFIKSKCATLGINNYLVVILESPTRGQAETVYMGLKELNYKDDESITIFNIDTFRPGFVYPEDIDFNSVDGYLEAFVGSGDNWSNVLPDQEERNKVILTAEKKGISKFCCTGLYYWASFVKFMSLFEQYQLKKLNDVDAGEYYIAPMYNYLIAEGGDVRFSIIPSTEVIFCGIPSEFVDFSRG
jgi:dTDP-glucose pyrophosphorylase